MAGAGLLSRCIDRPGTGKHASKANCAEVARVVGSPAAGIWPERAE